MPSKKRDLSPNQKNVITRPWGDNSILFYFPLNLNQYNYLLFYLSNGYEMCETSLNIYSGWIPLTLTRWTIWPTSNESRATSKKPHGYTWRLSKFSQNLQRRIPIWHPFYSSKASLTKHWCITKRQSGYSRRLLMRTATWATHWRRCTTSRERCSATRELSRSIRPLLTPTPIWPQFTKIPETFPRPYSRTGPHWS